MPERERLHSEKCADGTSVSMVPPNSPLSLTWTAKSPPLLLAAATTWMRQHGTGKDDRTNPSVAPRVGPLLAITQDGSHHTV